MKATSPDSELEKLQNDWKEMFQQTLPKAAQSKSLAQRKWPVHVDHCFARIILDKVIGISTPWMSKIKSPAYKNMSSHQLHDAITLGQQILDGDVDLVELDSFSLEVRGKGKGKGKSGLVSGKVKKGDVVGKRKRDDAEGEETKEGKRVKERSEEEGDEDREETKSSGTSKYFIKEEPKKLSDQDMKPKSNHEEEQQQPPPSLNKQPEDLKPWLKKIALCDKTDFQKKVLIALCQVPLGSYSTYGALAKHLSSSPRAVGNALRNNPFAPQVPCHRILASSGNLGGFGGSWGRNGEAGLNDDKKLKLLRAEGVRFDGRGKVVGRAWEGFV